MGSTGWVRLRSAIWKHCWRMEAEERDRHAVQTRMHDARLPRIKTLEELDFNQTPHILHT